ncbi:hypothetical protein [Canibacter oris]|uniref:Uncharacterized protein n=1 Tax=Canibacter oris TaxID=1365628 RepID=A0A840DF96_9MICO|nr:hypothetical protein [Canibacter oris]MBB4071744.1 hypothetical protein [Canibacter oris]
MSNPLSTLQENISGERALAMLSTWFKQKVLDKISAADIVASSVGIAAGFVMNALVRNSFAHTPENILDILPLNFLHTVFWLVMLGNMQSRHSWARVLLTYRFIFLPLLAYPEGVIWFLGIYAYPLALNLPIIIVIMLATPFAPTWMAIWGCHVLHTERKALKRNTTLFTADYYAAAVFPSPLKSR